MNKNQRSKFKSQNVNNMIIKIVEKKREDVKKFKSQNSKVKSISQNAKEKNIFFTSMLSANTIGLIGEIKFASPAHPSLGDPKTLLERVALYEKNGVDAISLITEPHFFKGDIAFVRKVKQHVSLPVLQKDFVIDEGQIYEAAAIGSDALLLIARIVDKKTLQYFVTVCFAEGVEPVVEVANDEDLQKALTTQARIIAVNARDLETFAVDVAKACMLLQKIPKQFITLGFSGIQSAKEIQQYKEAEVKGVLVGTSLMKAKNVGEFIQLFKKNL